MGTFARIACGKICQMVERIEEVEMINQPRAGLEIADSMIKKSLEDAFRAVLELLAVCSENRC